MPQFEVTTFSSQLFWLFTIFSLLYFVVSRYIAPKIEKVISSRDNYLASNINLAQEYNDKVKSIEAHKETILAEINGQITDMKNLSMDMFNQEQQKKIESLDKKIEKQQQKNTDNIAQYIQDFKSKESAYCLSLAATIIEKITNKPADQTILSKIQTKL